MVMGSNPVKALIFFRLSFHKSSTTAFEVFNKCMHVLLNLSFHIQQQPSIPLAVKGFFCLFPMTEEKSLRTSNTSPSVLFHRPVSI